MAFVRNPFVTSLITSLVIVVAWWLAVYALLMQKLTTIQTDSSWERAVQDIYSDEALQHHLRVFQQAITRNIDSMRQRVVLIEWQQNVQLDSVDPLNPTKVVWQAWLSRGNGVIISSDGYVLTNKHVVQNTDARYTLILADDSVVTVDNVWLDPLLDLAILKVTPTAFMSGLDTLPILARERSFGQWDLVLRVSAQDSDPVAFVMWYPSMQYARFGSIIYRPLITLPIASKPGFSGSPVTNMLGELVGLVTSVDANATTSVLPLTQELYDTMLLYIRTANSLERPKLGIQYTDINQQSGAMAAALSGGIYLTDVYDDGLAYAAGLRAGDIVFSINGIAIDTNNSFLYQWLYMKPGDVLKLQVLRNGDYISVSLTLPENQ